MPIHPKGVTNKTNRKLTIKNITFDIISPKIHQSFLFLFWSTTTTFWIIIVTAPFAIKTPIIIT